MAGESMTKKILIVGCGSIGERHVRCFAKTGRAQVVACEINRTVLEKIRQEYQVPGHADLHEALSSQSFDGIVICTPADSHIALALPALQSSDGLLIEKPLSVSLDKIEELKQEIERTRKYVGVAYVNRFVPAVRAGRDFLRTAVLGEPLQVTVTAGQHFPTYRPAYRDIYYSSHATGGGAIQDALTHMANVVEWLVGPTNKVVCDAAHQALEGVAVEDAVSVTARNNNVLVSYALNQFQAPNENCVQVHCARGSLKIEIPEHRWAEFPRDASAWNYHEARVNHRDDLFVSQANAFLDELDGKSDALCTFDEAVQTLKFNLAALESSRTGRYVAIV
jgi:predicted dehydrogenase